MHLVSRSTARAYRITTDSTLPIKRLLRHRSDVSSIQDRWESTFDFGSHSSVTRRKWGTTLARERKRLVVRPKHLDRVVDGVVGDVSDPPSLRQTNARRSEDGLEVDVRWEGVGWRWGW